MLVVVPNPNVPEVPIQDIRTVTEGLQPGGHHLLCCCLPLRDVFARVPPPRERVTSSADAIGGTLSLRVDVGEVVPLPHVLRVRLRSLREVRFLRERHDTGFLALLIHELEDPLANRNEGNIHTGGRLRCDGLRSR